MVFIYGTSNLETNLEKNEIENLLEYSMTKLNNSFNNFATRRDIVNWINFIYSEARLLMKQETKVFGVFNQILKKLNDTFIKRLVD